VSSFFLEAYDYDLESVLQTYYDEQRASAPVPAPVPTPAMADEPLNTHVYNDRLHRVTVPTPESRDRTKALDFGFCAPKAPTPTPTPSTLVPPPADAFPADAPPIDASLGPTTPVAASHEAARPDPPNSFLLSHPEPHHLRMALQAHELTGLSITASTLLLETHGWIFESVMNTHFDAQATMADG
jgi:hypothetical protein